MKWTSFGAFVAVLVWGTAVQAGMPFPQKMKCAVGGEAFTHIGTASYSTWGSRPDGKPYGSWSFPLAIPECPGNKLVMYREFTPAEMGRLASLLDSAEYKALATHDSTYYRAAWLERALNPGSEAAIFLLFRASWQMDDNAERKAAYQREFAERSAAMPAKPEDIEWLFLEFRAANALREIGQFDAALARLRAIPRDGLDVKVPKATDANYAAIDEAESRLWLLKQIPVLEAAIARRDPSSEPLELIPVAMAAGRCVDAPDPAALQPAGFCMRRDVAKEAAEIRAARAKYGD